ncbi:hypothetical protein BH24GEM2_BH24GEM2_08560 [soil metagenome]
MSAIVGPTIDLLAVISVADFREAGSEQALQNFAGKQEPFIDPNLSLCRFQQHFLIPLDRSTHA